MCYFYILYTIIMGLKNYIAWLMMWASLLGNAQTHELVQSKWKNQLIETLNTDKKNLEMDIKHLITQYKWSISEDKIYNMIESFSKLEDFQDIDYMDDLKINSIIYHAIDSLDGEWLVGRIGNKEKEKEIISEWLSKIIINNKESLDKYKQWLITEKDLLSILKSSKEYDEIDKLRIDDSNLDRDSRLSMVVIILLVLQSRTLTARLKASNKRSDILDERSNWNI